IFASVTKFGRMLAGDLEQFSQLRFRYPAPDYAAAYAPYFRLPVAFDQPRNAIELPRHRLDQRLEGGFARLHEQAERRVGQLLAQMPRRTGLVAAMEAAFEQDPALFAQGIDGMSRVLGIHPRTLQRRLHAEGDAFGTVVDRVRYRLAIKALQETALDMETISEQLGFSDRRSFTRAFTRWSSVSPSSFRHRRDP
ncbi:MAG: helix-turn-helix transcriptional regulator, partial [Pseudomonadota bacterium]|nr:helix-turn-helix transcriptional regulator [Pseudomonadota bacterium]